MSTCEGSWGGILFEESPSEPRRMLGRRIMILDEVMLPRMLEEEREGLGKVDNADRDVGNGWFVVSSLRNPRCHPQ